MNAPPLSLGQAPLSAGATGTTVTCACDNVLANPTYTITVQVDFPPAVNYFLWLMPKPNPSSTNVRYTATLTGTP
jgi:hypothetical protein